MKSEQKYIILGVFIAAVAVVSLVSMKSDKGGNDAVLPDAENEAAGETSQTSTQSQGSQSPQGSGSKPSSSVTGAPSSSVNPTVTPGKPVPSTPTAASLDGSTFKLTTINGSPVSASSKYTLSFSGNILSVELCNSLSGNYYLDGNKLVVNNLISTRKYCSTPSNLMKIEADISYMLNSGATQIYRSGSTLILSHSQGIVMSFEGF